MDIIANSIPNDVYSLLLTVAAALIAVWFAFFILRKLIGVAVLAVVLVGGLMAWYDPSTLRSAQHFATSAYDQWRYSDSNEDGFRPYR
ncbi:hypothetical protein DXT90_22605 [Agrobacterium tumefaciens]|nr:hypothetical protein [Agrobacterium tumefaciens]